VHIELFVVVSSHQRVLCVVNYPAEHGVVVGSGIWYGWGCFGVKGVNNPKAVNEVRKSSALSTIAVGTTKVRSAR
jgi:hypothetical protein